MADELVAERAADSGDREREDHMFDRAAWPDIDTRLMSSRCFSGAIRPSTARSKMSSGASSE